jgi:hypothetical protein
LDLNRIKTHSQEKNALSGENIEKRKFIMATTKSKGEPEQNQQNPRGEQ